jgi:hypothetical protein
VDGMDRNQWATTTGIRTGGDVFWATSWDEYARIQQEGVVVEMCVVDPVFRMR